MSSLARRATAEAIGTAFLLMAIVGSGIAAQRLSPDDDGLQLLINSLITGAALVALILTLQPLSASFNPVLTAVERSLGLLTTREATLSITAQMCGGVIGCVLANLMFELDAVSVSGADRASAGTMLAEVIATAGLVVIVFGSIRAGRFETLAYAVGGYITAAYWFTSSTSFANPAVTVARTLTDTFAGIAPSSVPGFVAMQVLGGAVGLGLVALLHPNSRSHHMTDQNQQQHRPTVLFVCVHNAGRSQMAAGYLHHLAGDRIDVLSAGSQPADQVNPVAIEAMAEEGIDIHDGHPQLLSDSAVQSADVVVTMGCGDACPFYPGKRYEDWVLDDPAGQGLDAVRPIRDEIRNRVEKLITDIDAEIHPVR